MFTKLALPRVEGAKEGRGKRSPIYIMELTPGANPIACKSLEILGHEFIIIKEGYFTLPLPH